MSSNRRMLLAAVGVALSSPAFARESAPPPMDAVAAIEAPQEEDVPMARPPEVAADADVACELEGCQVMTANTKGPSYEDLFPDSILASLEP